MAPPDVTLLYSNEVVEWDVYLSRQFESFEDQESVAIAHEQIEDISFPISAPHISHFSDARVVLVIVSPAFLEFLDHHADEGFQIGKLLKPGRTVAMLCGVQPCDISPFHKAALVSYNDWPQIVALDKDLNMVRNVVDTIHDILARSRENERIHKPKFKLIPRKVNEGNGKVFMILQKPVEDSRKIKISLEGNGVGVKDVSVKRRNPYTFQFTVPDNCLQVSSVLNVHVRSNDDFLGVAQLKCESRMGELYNLLSAVNSPYEFLCHTLGMASLHEVDGHLTENFQKNLPNTGFPLLKSENKCEKKKSKEEFPTLLHFAARYGLGNLVKEILQCPGANTACFLKNSRGLIPAQMANHAGHNDIANTLETFQKSMVICERALINDDRVIKPMTITCEKKRCKEMAHMNYYDIPLPNPVPVTTSAVSLLTNGYTTTCEKDGEYLNMIGPLSPPSENLKPHKEISLETEKQPEKEVFLPPLSDCNGTTASEVLSTERIKITLLESQAKLIEIMEAYKKGASLTEVEKLHNEWKATHKISDLEAKSTLDELKSLYAKAQKLKMSKKQSSSFSELRHFIGSKLRRKDSVSSKANSNRKDSRELTSIEKLCMEVDGMRPVSTLSSMSTTSSSSGSSFDRLSSVSGGSDSGNHSDFCEEVNRIKEAIKFDSRSLDFVTTSGNLQRNHQFVSLSDKPPAPPPRPVKPPLRVTTYENKMYSHKGNDSDYLLPPQPPIPTTCSSTKLMDYVLPDSFVSSGKSSDFVSSSKSSDSRSADNLFLPVDDSSDPQDSNSLYDSPVPPAARNDDLIKIGSCKSNVCRISTNGADHVVNGFVPMVTSQSSVVSPGLDYDMVPPPLPLSFPPRRASTSSYSDEVSLCYDIPKSFSPNCVCDTSKELNMKCSCPKLELSSSARNDICICNLSSCNPRRMTLLQNCQSQGSLYDFPVYMRKRSLPSVPSFESINNSQPLLPSSAADSSNNQVAAKLQYYNMCFVQNGETKDSRDSIPDVPPPPPPTEQGDDDDEEHYKLVGVPVPISDFSRISLPLKCSETFNTNSIQKSNEQTTKHLFTKNI